MLSSNESACILGILVLTLFLINLLFPRDRISSLPLVNDKENGEWLYRSAKKRFLSNARELIDFGFTKVLILCVSIKLL